MYVCSKHVRDCVMCMEPYGSKRCRKKLSAVRRVCIKLVIHVRWELKCMNYLLQSLDGSVMPKLRSCFCFCATWGYDSETEGLGLVVPRLTQVHIPSKRGQRWVKLLNMNTLFCHAPWQSLAWSQRSTAHIGLKYMLIRIQSKLAKHKCDPVQQHERDPTNPWVSHYLIGHWSKEMAVAFWRQLPVVRYCYERQMRLKTRSAYQENDHVWSRKSPGPRIS